MWRDGRPQKQQSALQSRWSEAQNRWTAITSFLTARDEGEFVRIYLQGTCLYPKKDF